MSWDPGQARTWAKAQRIPVSDRGRLPRAVIVGYLESNPSLARELGRDFGVPVAARGRVARRSCEQIANLM